MGLATRKVREGLSLSVQFIQVRSPCDCRGFPREVEGRRGFEVTDGGLARPWSMMQRANDF